MTDEPRIVAGPDPECRGENRACEYAHRPAVLMMAKAHSLAIGARVAEHGSFEFT